MLPLRVLLGLLVVGQVVLACLLWPELPASIPWHYDFDGRPNTWGAPDVEWFVISGVLGAIGVATGFVVPLVFRRWARTNSGLLNVPDRERFQKLPEEARVRAIATATGWLVVIACELQLLTAFLLAGSFLVAQKRWGGLPVVGLYGAFAALLLTAAGMAIASTLAVKREIAAAS